MGIAAVCVAGAAGSYAACAHLGVLPTLGLVAPPHQSDRARAAAVRHDRANGHHRDAHDRRGSVALRVTDHAATRTTPASAALTTTHPASVSVTVTTHRPHISAVRQIELEFGRRPVRLASAGHARTGRRRSAAIGQIEREFGTHPARLASTGVVDAGSGAVSSMTAAAGDGAPASAARAPATPQTPTQAKQTAAEFGFEK